MFNLSRNWQQITLLVAILLLPAFAVGQECSTSTCCDVDSCFGPSGGGWCESPQLTGDWGGFRTHLAESGISTEFNIANYYFGVVNGGLEQQGEFSGHGDYVFNFDGHKLLGMEGLFIKVRAEHRYGTTIGSSTGALLPPTVQSELPVADSEELYLTDVLFTQFLSPQFGVFFGKLDTFDGDQNAFASGRGTTQFSNLAFVVNPATLRTIPYSTLGFGFVILGADDPEEMFQFSVINATDTARTSGFDELFEEGVAISGEYRFPTKFFNKPGHQMIGATWSSRDVVALEQDPRIILPQVPINRTDGSWSIYYNFDQYLFMDPCDPKKGWGVFGRAGLADDRNNPVAWFLSLGLGGDSPISGRKNDTFGAGWYYSGTSDEIGPVLNNLAGGVGDGQGIELFYNYQVTPSFHLTPDMQIIMPARQQIDTAILLGLRGVITL